MKIIYCSDFNCPYSYIGLNRLKRAVDEVDVEAAWEMKPFELEPEAGKEPTSSAVRQYAVKYGLTPQDAESEIDEIERIARDEGLKIDYRNVKITSSRDAHRLVKFAQNKDLKVAQELAEKIYDANFSKNENIASHEVLMKLAASAGLVENEVKEMLESDSLQIEVELDEEDALLNGISAIPCYILEIGGERLTIPGAFEKEDFKIAIEDMISGEIENKTFL